jgi:hypothetical protein
LLGELIHIGFNMARWLLEFSALEKGLEEMSTIQSPFSEPPVQAGENQSEDEDFKYHLRPRTA